MQALFNLIFLAAKFRRGWEVSNPLRDILENIQVKKLLAADDVIFHSPHIITYFFDWYATLQFSGMRITMNLNAKITKNVTEIPFALIDRA